MAREASTNLARALRKSSPATEAKFWRVLRSRRLQGLKFRRQFPLGPYVLDYVCLRHRLVVELDGPLHDPVADQARDAFLVAKGFRVLRFPNSEVHRLDSDVIQKILAAAAETPPLREV